MIDGSISDQDRKALATFSRGYDDGYLIGRRRRIDADLFAQGDEGKLLAFTLELNNELGKRERQDDRAQDLKDRLLSGDLKYLPDVELAVLSTLAREEPI